MMNSVRHRMKKRNPSSGQNGELVHWWLLVHSSRIIARGQLDGWKGLIGRFEEWRLIQDEPGQMKVGVHPFRFEKGWVGIKSHGSLYCIYNWYLVFSGCIMEYSCDVLQGCLIACFDFWKFISVILIFNNPIRNPIRMAIMN